MTTHLSFVYLLLCAGIIMSNQEIAVSQGPEPSQGRSSVTEARFGKTQEGKDVTCYTLTSAKGLRAKVMEYGAILVSLEVPDRAGKAVSIVQGFDSLDSYISKPSTLGATIGRYANRISNARFILDGMEYRLTANAGTNHIHGGQERCFHKVVWKGQTYQSDTEAGVRLIHLSRDGEEGFPGNLTCTVTYSLTKAGDLKIGYTATTDKPTVLNLTNHSFFNLAGAQSQDILGHELMINALWYTPVGEGLIPTGEIRSVEGTPLDFTQPRTIGQGIAKMTETRIYDHNFVLNGSYGSLVLAARVYEPNSGRVMEVYTTEPGMQFYTGKGSAFCLETQHFPDSPNKPHFPSTVLRPGQRYESTTVFKFSTK